MAPIERFDCIKLYYGWKSDECGVDHAFLMADPDNDPYYEGHIAESTLAEMLDTNPDDQDFNWNVSWFRIPKLLAERIRAEAVNDYLAEHEEK